MQWKSLCVCSRTFPFATYMPWAISAAVYELYKMNYHRKYNNFNELNRIICTVYSTILIQHLI